MTAGALAAAFRHPQGAPEESAGIPAAAAVAAEGRHQAGVDRPLPAQQHLSLAVFGLADRGRAPRLVQKLGADVLALTSTDDARLAGQDPGDLTVTVGVGPALVAAVDRTLPGADGLPDFAGDRIAPACRGGDVLVQVCGGDPVAVGLAADALVQTLAGQGARLRWSQRGFRASLSSSADAGHATRNLVGFLDGMVGPHTPAELARHVWLDGPGPVAGATVAVVRRLRVDVAGFLALPVRRQEQVIGRRRADGAPLSGGDVNAPVNLDAKSPDGRYLIPALAHVRRANPRAAGAGMMLRRGYSYDNGNRDRGLVFVSFQRELATFVSVQRRLDEGDDLMAFTTATASGAFLVLPGMADGRPLGHPLFTD